MSLLKSAKEYATQLKSIAITGSVNAITTGDDLATRILTNDSWNSITIEQAKEMNNPFISCPYLQHLNALSHELLIM
jgi:hypothetical protein